MMKSKKKSERKKRAAVRVERIISLRREWKRREDDLLNGKSWSVNDKACLQARANKAEGIHECIADLNWMLSQKAG